MERQRHEQNEIDLLELFFQLLHYWKLILLSMILAGAIAFSFSKFMITPKYQSTSELYVLSKSTSLTSLTDLQLGTNLTNDYIVVVVGRPVLDQVISNLKLEMNFKQLKEMVSVNNPSNSRILQLTVTDTDPVRAKAIADELADVSAAFIAEKMDQDPPSILQYGYVATAKVSPSLSKNTAMGAIVGFILAAAIVICSYLLDDSIMTADDIEKKLDINVLGQIPFNVEEYDGKSSKSKRFKKNANKQKVKNKK